MDDKPKITPEELATFGRCTFARQLFVSHPSLRAKKPMRADDLPPDSREGEWHVSKPYTGEPFDTDEWELREGGWDHEHCDVCWGKLVDGMSYWPNINPDVGQVDLCEACYPRVMTLLRAAPDAEPSAAASAALSDVAECRGMEEQTVGLGATRDELRHFLGNPTDTSVPTQRQWHPLIWRYGEVEYHFGTDGRVWMVYTEDAYGNPRVLGRLTEG